MCGVSSHYEHFFLWWQLSKLTMYLEWHIPPPTAVLSQLLVFSHNQIYRSSDFWQLSLFLHGYYGLICLLTPIFVHKNYETKGLVLTMALTILNADSSNAVQLDMYYRSYAHCWRVLISCFYCCSGSNAASAKLSLAYIQIMRSVTHENAVWGSHLLNNTYC